MTALAYGAFAVQGAVMIADEFWFHRRREMPRWERIGHPLDTALFVAALAWASVAARSPASVAVFIGLSVASCLVITKDEWIHADKCSGGEQWTHAVLFVIHPVALFAANAIWAAGAPLWPVAAGVAAFGCWQAIYWNVVRRAS
jgi:hypothetical protein